MRNVLLAVAGISVLVIGVLAVGCGGDDDDSGGDGPSATQEQSQPSDSGGDGGQATDAATQTAPPDDGGNGGSVDTSEVCSVLTKDEVEAAFGVSMMDPELISLPDMPISGGAVASVSSCSYVAEETTESMSFTVTSAPDNEAGIEALIDLACQNKDEVSGLGDKACWYSEAHTEIQMQIGTSFVDLFVTTVSGDTTEITSSLAQTVAERLG
jgi:hypothetical protein